jgi:hypothetical protein
MIVCEKIKPKNTNFHKYDHCENTKFQKYDR